MALDPQLAGFLQELQDSGNPPLYTLSPVDARAAYAKGVELLALRGPNVGGLIDKVIDTKQGQVPVRIYTPDHSQEPAPLIIYFHGGGWSFGSVETHDSFCRILCSGTTSIVVSVEYSLAPELKFPRAVNDAIEASIWACAMAESLGADPSRIVLAGDSAGANLAAVAALALRDRNLSNIFCQLLIYPATDQSMSYPSHQQFGDDYRLTRPLMVWSSMNYLRDGRDIMDFRASPLFAEDHTGLPPAVIVTAGFDPLRDEGEAYAIQLRNAGVEVDYRCFDSLIHGFIGLTGAVDAAAAAVDEIILMLRGRLECHS